MYLVRTNFTSYHHRPVAGKIVVFFFWDETPDAFFGLECSKKMIFLLYGPNFLLFPKEEKEKSCNNLKNKCKAPKLKAMHKWGERFQVRGLVIRREGISTQRIYSTL